MVTQEPKGQGWKGKASERTGQRQLKGGGKQQNVHQAETSMDHREGGTSLVPSRCWHSPGAPVIGREGGDGH